MSLKRFFVISVFVHMILFAGIYFVPETKEKKTREFITKLVTPETKKPEIRQPKKKIKPAIPLPPPSRIRPVPSVPHMGRALPIPPPVKARPRQQPTPGVPLIPGEVKEGGPASPGEGKFPRKGKGGEAGEGDVKDTKNAIEPAKPGLPGRKELFDWGITDAIARKDSGKAGNGIKNDDAITFDTREYRFAGYMNKLRDKIESIWVYPPEAAASGKYGDLKIRFTIKKDGKLGAVELMRTSGYTMLDDAAVRALKDGEPYWPLPDSWGMDTYTVEGHFIYSLYGYHLR